MMEQTSEELLELVKDFVEDVTKSHDVKFPLLLVGISGKIYVYEKVDEKHLAEVCGLLKNNCEWYSVILASNNNTQIMLRLFGATGEKELMAIIGEGNG